MTPDERRSLELRFHSDMVNGIRSLSREIGYRAPRFAQMVNEHGGAKAARILLGGPRTSEGFQILHRHDKLDHSVEAWVLRPEYEALFSPAERLAARERLEAHEFDVDRYLRSLANS
jgi:hypothetical protein